MSEKIANRIAYGKALLEYGGDPKIVVLDSDLSTCTMTCYFAEKYPDRFFNVGICEANMVDIGAGIASTGKNVFVNSFAMFAAGRAFEPIRNSVAYPHLNVKIVGSHAGLSVGRDGATHQCLEDLGIMRTIPGMTVLFPCDANETREAVKTLVHYDGPVYMRTGRLPVEDVTSSIPGYRFEIGKGVLLKDGRDGAIIATGNMVQESLDAAKTLEKEGVHVRVIDMHTLKPFDSDIVLKAAEECGVIVTAEEHNIIGALGSAVCECLCEAGKGVPVLRMGVHDEFGHSGDGLELLEAYHLLAADVVKTVKKAVSLKK